MEPVSLRAQPPVMRPTRAPLHFGLPTAAPHQGMSMMPSPRPAHTGPPCFALPQHPPPPCRQPRTPVLSPRQSPMMHNPAVSMAMPMPGTIPQHILRGIQAMQERFRCTGSPFPPNMLPPSSARFHLPPPMPLPPAFPGSFLPPDPRLLGPCAAPFSPSFMFNQDDLDMILYGYAKNKVNEALPGHALSGLRIGMDNPLPMTPPRTTVHSAVDPTALELPEGLELFHTTFAGSVHYGVFCKKAVISKGTRFGPFLGKLVNMSEIKTNDDNSFMWEIFTNGKLSHFVDGRGSSGNWLAYVNCARYAQEQNLLAVQESEKIFYEVCKDIPQGTELLVWYGDGYLQFMGIPVALKESGSDVNTQQEMEARANNDGFPCDRCGKVFAYKYYRDKHLKYTRCVDMGDRKFPCHLCSRSFEKRDRLRIHILHVHEKHRPHKCSVCGKSFSQSSSLNKHMRVHSGERPYKCVYCSKAFTASSILRTHIRQHSGEKPFKCKHCGKAFASHAAHDSHVRRTHTKERPSVCRMCGKAFSQIYELKFHMKTHEMEMGVGAMNMDHLDDNMNKKFEDHREEAIDVVGMGTEGLVSI